MQPELRLMQAEHNSTMILRPIKLLGEGKRQLNTDTHQQQAIIQLLMVCLCHVLSEGRGSLTVCQQWKRSACCIHSPT